ncbi:hypothetical protein F2Q69_00056610 [Brassica cretica]|uniref:ATPase AAA-type core domain-containing protein n=1 Tax=Brassica cretica TaxID=69181 RepID=A0A8S9N8I3_BRACR|nr:hypothetical protein F2Q69_00056610 [Brassica cretica]
MSSSDSSSAESRLATAKTVLTTAENMYGTYSDAWTSVILDHPSKFKTLAMDSDAKRNVMEDLDQFVQRREFYKRVGKAWKRGYLLYGPPGTGKSSLIAAMANHLNFDIYDLELSAVNSNSELRRLMIATANRSILVVEDIDCSIELKDRTADEPTRESDEGSNRGKDAEMTFVKTGRRHQNAFLTGYELHYFNIVLCLITFL